MVRFLLRDVDLPFVDLNKPMSCGIPATGATNDAESSSRLPAASLVADQSTGRQSRARSDAIFHEG